MTLQEALRRDVLLLSDGGMGTELQKLGLPLNTCGDAWCLTHPDRVLSVHRQYVDAGSALISVLPLSVVTVILSREA